MYVKCKHFHKEELGGYGDFQFPQSQELENTAPGGNDWHEKQVPISPHAPFHGPLC